MSMLTVADENLVRNTYRKDILKVVMGRMCWILLFFFYFRWPCSVIEMVSYTLSCFLSGLTKSFPVSAGII